MELKEGMYVRTKKGTFDRLIYKRKNEEENYIWYNFEERGAITNPENYMLKASFNLIDLIEVGDYVNGLKVIEVRNDIKGFGVIIFDENTSIHEWQISSIVTKEQFSQMEYKVG